MGRGAQANGARRICGQYNRIAVSIRRVTALEGFGAQQEIEKILFITWTGPAHLPFKGTGDDAQVLEVSPKGIHNGTFHTNDELDK
jgi:hypothetical protein